MKISKKELKQTLDDLYRDYSENYERDPDGFFENRPDPIIFPRRYTSFHDREAAAFLAATFAYGNVTSVCAFIDRLLNLMQPSPHAFLLDGDESLATLSKRKPYYRLHKSTEILGLLSMLSEVYRRHGSLYELFLKHYRNAEGCLSNYNTMKIVLSEFVVRMRSLASLDLKFLVPSPADGSPCKRMSLFLRWMVRRKDMDFGLWSEVSPAHLIMPLDTHIGRIAYRLGWITTPSLTWRKAEKITEVLRQFDPQDPLRYDFALCHESMQKRIRMKNKTAKTPRILISSG